jgi:hypothetical protein
MHIVKVVALLLPMAFHARAFHLPHALDMKKLDMNTLSKFICSKAKVVDGRDNRGLYSTRMSTPASVGSMEYTQLGSSDLLVSK